MTSATNAPLRSPDQGMLTPTPVSHTFTDVQVSAAVSTEEAVSLAELFRLLGDPTRVRILYVLVEADELCVHDIATAVDTTETKVSQAMRLLRGAGIVRNRREGRHVFYRLDDDHVRTVLAVSREHIAHLDTTVSDSNETAN